jgi:predicted DNA-binding transcriptional regulator AlpA
MKEYEFTLKFGLPDTGADPDAYVAELAANGCEDALIGVGASGRIALDFCREAPSAYEAMRSALADVKSAIPEARLIEATPDYVGITDVADLLGFSRQNMRKLILSNPGSFPLPVHEGSSAIWHLAKVLGWLQERGRYPVDAGLLELSEVAMQVNLARERQHVNPSLEQGLTVIV